jgi:hypothetical protein
MFQDTWDALWASGGIFEPSLTEFESIFAPVPPQPDDTSLQILLIFISLGATALAAPIFNSCECQFPSFTSNQCLLYKLNSPIQVAVFSRE